MPEGFLRRNGGIKLINIDIFDGGRIVTYGTAVADIGKRAERQGGG